MCIEALERHIKPGDTMLDLGCGSGILSVVGLKLGAGKCVAVDKNPNAAEITYQNAGINCISKDILSVYTGDIINDIFLQEQVSADKYDCIAANIVADVIIGLSPLIAGIGFVFMYACKVSESKALKLLFVLFALLPLMSVPAFILTADWGRWLASQYAGQILLILYLAKANCAPVIIALKRLSKHIKSQLILLLVFVLFFSLLGKYMDDEFPVETEKIVSQLFPNLSEEPLRIRLFDK